MSSPAERLRARLAAQRAQGSFDYENVNSSRDAGSRNVTRGHVDLRSGAYTEQLTSLRIAAAIYVRAREQCSVDYAEAGLAVFSSLVSPHWIGRYCLESYPDMCACGHWWTTGDSNLRRHCDVCRGKHQLQNLPYIIQRLEQETGIHYSWLEWGFSWALYYLNLKDYSGE